MFVKPNNFSFTKPLFIMKKMLQRFNASTGDQHWSVLFCFQVAFLGRTHSFPIIMPQQIPFQLK
jgi:hypothetical protein